MNIGILGHNFVNLIGAKDFFTNILYALTYELKNSDKIYVFVPPNNSYKKYKGLKRFIEKIKSYYDIQCYNAFFKEFNDLNIVICKSFNYKKYKKYNLDCLLLNTVDDINSGDIPVINYLYDCQHKYYPDFFTEEEIRQRDEHFKIMLEKPCIVNSKDTKNDLIKFYKADSNLIFNLPFTPKINLEYLNDNSSLIKKYNLPKRYFMMSNQFWIHKDHSTLFKAFAKLCENQQHKDVELVCTGTMFDYRNPNYVENLKKMLIDLKIDKRVHLLGLIPKEEQIEIMKHSIAVIQTTLFEGGPGGGSVWDACALGIPSIISDIKVNKEINESIVTFFEAKNWQDLAIKMDKVLNEPKSNIKNEDLLNKTINNVKILHDKLFEVVMKIIKK